MEAMNTPRPRLDLSDETDDSTEIDNADSVH